jgi:hypothetical protein
LLSAEYSDHVATLHETLIVALQRAQSRPSAERAYLERQILIAEIRQRPHDVKSSRRSDRADLDTKLRLAQARQREQARQRGVAAGGA